MQDPSPEPLEVKLRRLKDERTDADRRYHEALTALDKSLRPPPELADLPEPFDEHQITPLNESWNILPSPPDGGGLRGRFIRLIWAVMSPYLQRQLTFNSQVVDHINRNAAAARAAHGATAGMNTVLRDHLAALTQFQTLLIVYLQQITLYVDTKDRDSGGGALVLNAAISGLAEELSKRWESISARGRQYEARYEARTQGMASELEDLRTMLGVTQQLSVTLKRELEKWAAVPAPSAVPSATSRDAFAAELDAYKYVGFEDRFRGSREMIRERLETYVPYFESTNDVLDIGCGRGEFLDVLKAHGIKAQGIDLNHEMAEVCRARGLDVAEADAVSYLSSLDDQSLGGIFAAQVVEHLEPGYLLRFLELAFHKLRPGGRLVLETLNPACWVAFFESYIRDITHAWPLHPDTLKYLVIASGFTRADIEFRSPVPPQDRLQPVTPPSGADTSMGDFAEAFNSNVEKLNGRMFTFMDYAVVAEKAAMPFQSS